VRRGRGKERGQAPKYFGLEPPVCWSPTNSPRISILGFYICILMTSVPQRNIALINACEIQRSYSNKAYFSLTDSGEKDHRNLSSHSLTGWGFLTRLPELIDFICAIRMYEKNSQKFYRAGYRHSCCPILCLCGPGDVRCSIAHGIFCPLYKKLKILYVYKVANDVEYQTT